MSLAIRISRKYDDIFDWIDAIECEKLIVYEHEADKEVNRTHCHLLVLKPKCKPDALKTRFKKQYSPTDSGNPLWCWKSALDDDYETYITYMTKGVLSPKLIKGFDLSDMIALAEKYVDPEKTQVELQNGKFVRSVKETDKKTKRQMLEQMRSRLSDTSSTRDILKAIRKVLMDNNEVIGQYKQMDYYDAYMMYDRKEDWLMAMERKIVKKYEE